MRATNDVKGLLKALDSKDLRIVAAAEDAVEDIGHGTTGPFIGALRDRDTSVRSGAAWILGDIKGASAKETLIKALKDENKEVRWLTVAALGDIGDERAIHPISMVSTDDDEFLKEIVADARTNKGIKHLE